jgi:hypothetical protein
MKKFMKFIMKQMLFCIIKNGQVRMNADNVGKIVKSEISFGEILLLKTANTIEYSCFKR